ncbi:MAG: cobalamin-dependent protein, partial [bacterium]
MNTNQPTHPLGQKARVLLTSVFGPFAQDDDYGSRKINPMELYQNQVTRTQGGFSLRMFVRSFGLKLIQTNIDAPCMLLDFPDLDRFIQTIRDNPYDIIGISGIAPNLGKVRKMCELIRSHQPDATIVVGGHIANKVDIEKSIDADHIVKGDGVAWFRGFLKQDSTAPVKHPKMLSGFGTRILGLPVADKPKNTAAILIPSVGCPLGCNFCSTSAFFGGKGNFVNYYKTGQELFDVMCDIEKTLKVNSFFVMDENFLLNRKRALELLDLMQINGKSWALSIFSSARVLKTYTLDQLAGLGVAWVWIGLEGEESQYGKLKGIDTRKLVGELQATGIRVLGSSIIGMENHTPANIHGVIDYAVSH